MTRYVLRSLFLLIVLWATPEDTFAERGQVHGRCEQSRQTVTITSRIAQVVDQFERMYAACYVSVYLAGTKTLAQIYADADGDEKANRFKVTASDGTWSFFGNDGRYDIQLEVGNVVESFSVSTVPDAILDVRDYGAKCDDSTDDFVALQRAVDSAPDGQTLLIPGVC